MHPAINRQIEDNSNGRKQNTCRWDVSKNKCSPSEMSCEIKWDIYSQESWCDWRHHQHKNGHYHVCTSSGHKGFLCSGKFQSRKAPALLQEIFPTQGVSFNRKLGTGLERHVCTSSGHKGFFAAGNFKAEMHLHCCRKSFQHKVFPLTGNAAHTRSFP